MSQYDQTLYDALSQLRLELAQQANLPAYIIFHNRALLQMAQILPGTKENFLKIDGVGKARWEKYGTLFLDLIIKYCSEKGLSHGEVPPKMQRNEKHVPSTDLASLLEKMIAFYQTRDWEQFHSPKNLVMDLASEMGELVDPFRWLTEEQSYHLDAKTLEQVRDEIGDVFKTLVYLSCKLGIDPIDAASKKLDKMEQKYPADTCRGKALKYTAYKR